MFVEFALYSKKRQSLCELTSRLGLQRRREAGDERVAVSAEHRLGGGSASRKVNKRSMERQAKRNGLPACSSPRGSSQIDTNVRLRSFHTSLRVRSPTWDVDVVWPSRRLQPDSVYYQIHHRSFSLLPALTRKMSRREIARCLQVFLHDACYTAHFNIFYEKE